MMDKNAHDKEYEEVKLFNKVIRNKIKLNKKTNIWII
jgi:hypothetical protein